MQDSYLAENPINFKNLSVLDKMTRQKVCLILPSHLDL